jgi:hypothetical protein
MALTRRMGLTQTDRFESFLRDIDESTTEVAGVSLFHILTAASIAAAITLFASGRKMEGIFAGLWAPTLQALKSASERR